LLSQPTDIDEYFSGRSLYGDNFSDTKIREWYEDEKEAFTDLYIRQKTYSYEYHALNSYHCFCHLPRQMFKDVLGLGSAKGDEFLPIINNIKRLTIVEPSELYRDVKQVHGVPTEYVQPNISGDLPFVENRFDLIAALGVLHHIPNVSYVLKECSRCLAPNGLMLLRDPIISMGDWRHPRPGLTKWERGIPLGLFHKMVEAADMDIKYQSLCHFSPLIRLITKVGIDADNNAFVVRADAIFARLFSWNYQYHAKKFVDKIRPTVVYIVAKKPAI